MKAIEGFGRTKLDYEINEFIRHCRLRNLTQETRKYYQEDLTYFYRTMNLPYAHEVDSEVVEHEMDKGKRVAAINSRIHRIRVLRRRFVVFHAQYQDKERK